MAAAANHQKVKKLDKFILKSYIGPFILTFFISIFILLMQFLWRYLDEIVGKGLGAGVITELMLYACSSLVPMALPLAVLLSSIMTFGNLAEHYELMAIKSAGISLVKIMRPLIVFVIGVSICAFLFSNNIMPYTNLKMASLLYDIKHQKPEISITEGVFSDAIENYSIKVGRKSRKSPMLYDIMIYNHTGNNEGRDVTLADSGTMVITEDKRYMVITLYSGTNYVEETEKRRRWNEKEFPQRTTSFKEERFMIDLSGMGFERSNESLYKNGYAMLNLSQLQYTTDSLAKNYDNSTEHYLSNLTRGNYFKKLDFRGQDSSWYERTALSDTVKYVNIDSIMASLTKSDIEGVLSYAIENARDAKTYISQSAPEFFTRKKNIKRYEIEWHRKFTLSIACLLLFFIGAPLGAIIRKGGIGTPIVVSVLFFVIYYVTDISCAKAAKMGSWPAWLGMWLSPMVFAPMGAFLTYKAVKDATFLELSTYTDFFRKVFDKMMKNKQFAAVVHLFVSKEKMAKAKLAAEIEKRKNAFIHKTDNDATV